MSSILSGTAKLAGWTLGAAIIASTLVSSPDGAHSLGVLRALFLPSNGDAVSPHQVPEVQQSAPTLSPQQAAPAPEPIHFGDEVELKTGPDGNFHTNAEIDGMDVPMMVDTGASLVVLSYEEADRLGFRPLPSAFHYEIQTANGRTYFAQITLPYVRIGSIELDNVVAAVGSPGAVGREGLLGMTFLGRLQSYQASYGRLTLRN